MTEVVHEPHGRCATRPGRRAAGGRAGADELEPASENVLEGWPATDATRRRAGARRRPSPCPLDEPRVSRSRPSRPSRRRSPSRSPRLHRRPVDVPDRCRRPPSRLETSAEHAPGELEDPARLPRPRGRAARPPPRGRRRRQPLQRRDHGAAARRARSRSSSRSGVAQDAVTVMPVPGAFELPLAAMALAKTRRFACIVALGCVIRGDTPTSTTSRARPPRAAPARRDRDRGARLVRRAHARPRRPGRGALSTRAPRRCAPRSRWPTSSRNLRAAAAR